MTDTLSPTDYDAASAAEALLQDETARQSCYRNLASSFADVLSAQDLLEEKSAGFSEHLKEAKTRYGLTDAALRTAGIDPKAGDYKRPAPKKSAPRKASAKRAPAAGSSPAPAAQDEQQHQHG